MSALTMGPWPTMTERVSKVIGWPNFTRASLSYKKRGMTVLAESESKIKISIAISAVLASSPTEVTTRLTSPF